MTTLKLEIIRENHGQEISTGKPEELFSEEDSLTRKDNRDTPYTVLVETLMMNHISEQQVDPLTSTKMKTILRVAENN